MSTDARYWSLIAEMCLLLHASLTSCIPLSVQDAQTRAAR